MALEALWNAIESLGERIQEYNERIECLTQESYRQVALLKQIKGRGHDGLEEPRPPGFKREKGGAN